MPTNPARRAHSLAQQALDITTGINLPVWPSEADETGMADYWHIIVQAALFRANRILRSVTALLSPPIDDLVSATILNRNILECAADLVYLDQSVSSRLPEYLHKSGFPSLADDVAKVAEEKSDPLEVGLPRARWKALGPICEAIGWKAEYRYLYNIYSDSAHAGSSALVQEYLNMRGFTPTDANKATKVSACLLYHLRIAEIAAKLFPSVISLGSIRALQRTNLQFSKELSALPMIKDF